MNEEKPVGKWQQRLIDAGLLRDPNDRLLNTVRKRIDEKLFREQVGQDSKPAGRSSPPDRGM